MTPAEFAVNVFIALFALIDPIGNVPVFAAATQGASPNGRRLVALYISAFVLAFLAFFYFSGVALLQFFGISLPAFRIAGGILLLLLGLDMTRHDITAAFAGGPAAPEGETAGGYAMRRFEGMVVPFAMPLLIGPGAISAVVIYAAQAKKLGMAWTAAGLGAIGAVSVLTLLILLLTPLISKVLGRVGLIITVRVAGLILCAMAVQFIIVGVNDATRGLVRQSVAAPYADSKR